VTPWAAANIVWQDHVDQYTHAASNCRKEAELWVMDQEVVQMVVLPVIAVQWMNFAREIVAEKDGLVETLLMYEQLHSHGNGLISSDRL
jgi:hypothetical protein